jgi:hypothetical protein
MAKWAILFPICITVLPGTPAAAGIAAKDTMATVVPVLAALLRLGFNLPMFGSTTAEKIIFATNFMGTFLGSFSTVTFVAIARADMTRRRIALELLMNMSEYPGTF